MKGVNEGLKHSSRIWVNSTREAHGENMRTQFVAEGRVKLEVPELERFRTRAGDYAPSLPRVPKRCKVIEVEVAERLEKLRRVTRVKRVRKPISVEELKRVPRPRRKPRRLKE